RDLAMLKRRETHFLLLAAAGGYGLWLLRARALGSADVARARILFCTAPLLIGALSAFTRERAGLRTIGSLLLGFVGCAIIIVWGHNQPEGAEPASSAAGNLYALGAAACWAAFSLLARPIVREEKALPTAFLVTGIGAAFLLVTCLFARLSIFAVTSGQLKATILPGFFTVGLMMVFWLKCVGLVPAPIAAPFWYLGVLFGLLWVGKAGMTVSFWWALLGAGVVLFGVHAVAGARARTTATMSDVIRGWGSKEV
ncbi:unnamed protein product, partial [marine sediment metagenome]